MLLAESMIPAGGDGWGNMEIREVLNQATVDFTHCGIATPRLDAEVLLSYCLGTDRYGLYLQPELLVTEEAVRGFQRLVARRRRGEPVAYLTGYREFWSLLFEVNRDVLVPRPETEILVEEVLKACADEGRAKPRILEIGTGSGAISVAIASELSGATIVATDISMDALMVASRNAVKNGVADRIEFVRGDLFAPLAGNFDLIVSNPPYIAEHEFAHLPADVKEFEPPTALLAGPDGTAFHREIAREGWERLEKGGRLFMEIGYGQKGRVEAVLREMNRYEDIRFRNDYAGIERVMAARRKG
jgi:release factor glutamine methyltransferase